MELKRRVFIIGIDGADFDLIMPWVHQGYLPNLHKLLAEGSSGRLRSTIQPTSAPAWVTFMTGVNQGKHGLYDFVCRRSQSYDLQITNASHVKSPTIFDILSQVGGRSIVINLPYMVPPRSVNGIVVGGPFAASVTPDIVYPRSYFETLKRITPDYFILPDYDARASDPMMDYAEKLLKGVALRESLSL
ncbi:MAG: alkaline phosphatase family protein, partial [Anaerolineae bacterium]|nr:alkaline phosphatase family protein [Anaerolineae bacterium]